MTSSTNDPGSRGLGASVNSFLYDPQPLRQFPEMITDTDESHPWAPGRLSSAGPKRVESVGNGEGCTAQLHGAMAPTA